jgi:hypothetical protein
MEIILACSDRNGDIASSFFKEITKILKTLFHTNNGMVFEAEPYSKQRVEDIISRLEVSKASGIDEPSDQREIRNFLRILWYHRLNCFFFFDKDAGQPILCRAPCLDPSEPRENWSNTEEDYWLMWCGAVGGFVDNSRTKKLFRDTLNSIYLEILAKSLLETYPEREEYWNYSNAIVGKVLENTESKEISFNKFLDRELLRRWMSRDRSCNLMLASNHGLVRECLTITMRGGLPTRPTLRACANNVSRRALSWYRRTRSRIQASGWQQPQ